MAALRAYRTSIGLFALALALRLCAFAVFGRDPLGYDAGFYRRYLIQPLISIPNAPVPGLGPDALVPRILFDLLRLAHLPPDLIFYGTYLLCFAALPVLLYRLVRPALGERGGLIAGLLMVFSSVSYTAFTYALWKNAFALDLLLLALMLLERGRLLPVLALDILIALSHRTTAIVYGAALACYFVIAPGRRRRTLLHLAALGACFAAVNLPLLRSVGAGGAGAPVAYFIGWKEYLALSAPLFLLILSGAGLRMRALPRPLLAFAAAAALFPLLRLPFYERIFIFLDVAVAALAAGGLAALISRARPASRWYARAAVACIAIGLLLGNAWQRFFTLAPPFPESDIQEIAAIGQGVPPGALLLTTSSEAPWYEGWTAAHIAAPGMLRDTHDEAQWNAFWDATGTAARIAFLASFPQPLYVSTLGNPSILVGAPLACLTALGPHLWRDDCPAPRLQQ